MSRMTKILLSKRHRLLWLTVLYVVAIVAIIVAANSGVLPVRFLRHIPGGDKTGHFVLMGMLTFLVNLSVAGLGWRLTVPQVCLGLWIVIGLEELSQLGFSHRNFDLADLAADTLGVFFFGILAAIFLSLHRSQKSPPPRTAERSTM